MSIRRRRGQPPRGANYPTNCRQVPDDTPMPDVPLVTQFRSDRICKFLRALDSSVKGPLAKKLQTDPIIVHAAEDLAIWIDTPYQATENLSASLGKALRLEMAPLVYRLQPIFTDNRFVCSNRSSEAPTRARAVALREQEPAVA